MIRKLLIANRGEIACRIIRTCQQMGITTVAVFSDIDRSAWHVALADEAIYIGGNAATDSYLNIQNIITAAHRTSADAIHPGYGFLAENPQFAQAVIDAGLIWVGPQADVIAAMGDKRQAKQILDNIPYVPGYVDDDQSDDALLDAANTIGYPIMIKAAAGGGGKGMRAVTDAESMLDAIAAARREAQQAFGDDTLMLEKQVINPRHIEVQIIGDHHGKVIALGERECSIQRRHQKIIEESPAANLTADLRQAIHQTAITIGEQINYQNAGTVEFLLDADGNFYFMEMNTRLQVEHPVTEMVYGVDLVAWQLDIAQGATLDTLITDNNVSFKPNGHAIEVRIYAEDPYNEFLPVTGDILHWQAPDTVRVDAGIRSGDRVSQYYDPMLAKIIAHGGNRQLAIRKLDHALSQVQLLGMRNNIQFLRTVLMHEQHLSGNISTQFLEQQSDLMIDNSAYPDSVLIAAAFAKGGIKHQWRNNPNRPIRHRFAIGEQTNDVHITHHNDAYIVMIDDANYAVTLEAHNDAHLILIIDGHRQIFTILAGKNDQWWVHSRYGTYRLDWKTPLPLPQSAIASAGSLRAPMPGQVISLDVAVGQAVEQGEVLLIMEAMKMEHRIKAPYDGVVESITYQIGDTVQQDDELVTLSANTEQA